MGDHNKQAHSFDKFLATYYNFWSHRFPIGQLFWIKQIPLCHCIEIKSHFNTNSKSNSFFKYFYWNHLFMIGRKEQMQL